MTSTKQRFDVWMPMYWGDYAKDTGHLSDGEHGAYLMLIKQLWCTGSPLPDDDRILCRIACCDSLRTWKLRRVVLAPFFQIEAGFWTHRRVNRELSRADSITLKRKTSGALGGRKRLKSQDGDEALAEQMHSETVDSDKQTPKQTGTQSQSPVEEEDKPSGGIIVAATPPPPKKVDIGDLLRRGCDILGVRLESDLTRITWPGDVGRLVDEGCDPEKHILQAFTIAKARGKDSIAYIAATARSLLQESRKPPAAAPAGARVIGVTSRADMVRNLLIVFRDHGIWPSTEGPPPPDPDCCVDHALLVEFGYRKRGAA